MPRSARFFAVLAVLLCALSPVGPFEAAAQTRFAEQTGADNPLAGFSFGPDTHPVVVDLNGDGALDVLVGAADGSIAYLENTGAVGEPAFTRKTGAENPLSDVTAHRGRFAAGDADGDGDPDVVAAAPEGGLTYVENTGSATNPSFASASASPFDASRYVGLVAAPALGNVTGSGRPDVLVGSSAGALVYLETDAAGSSLQFAQQASTPPVQASAPALSAPALGDVDGDGDTDAMIGTLAGRVRLLVNADTSDAPRLYRAREDTVRGVRPGSAASPALGDLSGEGLPDLVLGGSNGELRYLVQQANADVALAGGRGEGRTYAPPAGNPGTGANPVGRLRLAADGAGAVLDSLAVANAGSALDGVRRVELWRSSDDTFTPEGGDEIVAADSSSAPAVFEGLDLSIATDTTTLFVAVDLASDASGDYEPVVESEAAVHIRGGALARVNGTAASAFSNAYLSAGATALPVELAGLSATADGETVRLQWATAGERGNAGFAVERKAFTGTGPANWTKTGFVDGSGTTAETRRYRFVDETVPFAADSVRYRLRQIDAGGGSRISGAVTIQRSVDRLRLLGTVPNPARERVTLRYALPDDAKVRVALYDVLGRRVREVRSGRTRAGRTETQVDVNELASGTYFVRLTTEEQVRTKRLTVVR
jgi:hypothetical protein